MTPQTKTRAAIAMLVYMLANAVLFGAGLIVVLTASGGAAAIWIPVVVVVSLVMAAPIAWEMAPQLRARHWTHADLQPLTLRVQPSFRRR